MAIDIEGFITYLKDHAVEHGFHVHDERHFIETYSLRQSWEIDVHPEDACDGPLDLHLALDVDPRLVLKLEDEVANMDLEFSEPDRKAYLAPLLFNWQLPPLLSPPDLIILATELAAIGGTVLPIDVSGVDSFGAISQAPERRLNLVGRTEVSLVDVMLGREELCEVLDLCMAVSRYLVEHTPEWEPIDRR